MDCEIATCAACKKTAPFLREQQRVAAERLELRAQSGEIAVHLGNESGAMACGQRDPNKVVFTDASGGVTCKNCLRSMAAKERQALEDLAATRPVPVAGALNERTDKSPATTEADRLAVTWAAAGGAEVLHFADPDPTDAGRSACRLTSGLVTTQSSKVTCPICMGTPLHAGVRAAARASFEPAPGAPRAASHPYAPGAMHFPIGRGVADVRFACGEGSIGSLDLDQVDCADCRHTPAFEAAWQARAAAAAAAAAAPAVAVDLGDAEMPAVHLRLQGAPACSSKSELHTAAHIQVTCGNCRRTTTFAEVARKSAAMVAGELPMTAEVFRNLGLRECAAFSKHSPAAAKRLWAECFPDTDGSAFLGARPAAPRAEPQAAPCPEPTVRDRDGAQGVAWAAIRHAVELETDPVTYLEKLKLAQDAFFALDLGPDVQTHRLGSVTEWSGMSDLTDAQRAADGERMAALHEARTLEAILVEAGGAHSEVGHLWRQTRRELEPGPGATREEREAFERVELLVLQSIERSQGYEARTLGQLRPVFERARAANLRAVAQGLPSFEVDGALVSVSVVDVDTDTRQESYQRIRDLVYVAPLEATP